MRDFVVRLRQQLVPEVKNLTAPAIHNGSQRFVLWKNRQFAANRMRYAGGALQIKDDGLPPDIGRRPGPDRARPIRPPSSATRRPSTRFCATFPDAFFVSERARVYLDPKKEKKLAGRLLSAGFHSMTGYFRDDGPLYELILDGPGSASWTACGRSSTSSTPLPMRQYTSFIWFERTDSRFMRDPEFDFVRAEDKDVTSEAKIEHLAEVYLAKARRNDASEAALRGDSRLLRRASRPASAGSSKLALAAEPSHVQALQEFAERAYRRPLSQAERDDIGSFYRTLREQEGLSHEDAVRDTLVSVLMSPHFCYRVSIGRRPGTGVQPLVGLRPGQPA